MRKLILILLTTLPALLCIGCALSQYKLVSVETIERIKSTAVPIVCGSPTKEGDFRVNKIIGSGFFINEEGYFLTAGHVFNNWEKIDRTRGDCFPAIYMTIGGWKTESAKVRWFGFDTCVRNADADVAVCKPKLNPFATEDVKNQVGFVTFGASLNLKDGTPVAFTGFPLDFLNPVTSKGNIASYIGADKRIVIDNNAWPGASGSPVYLSDGQVIGVVIQRGINEGTGLAYARAAESVVEFLTKNKIRFTHKK